MQSKFQILNEVRICLSVIALIILSCNSNQNQGTQEMNKNLVKKCSVYPLSIDSLHLRALFDSARWSIYTWHCDQSYLPKSDSSKSIPFGELPLQFDNVRIYNDTVELNFYFMDGSQKILSGMTRDFKELSTGAGFSLNTKRKIYMNSPNGFSIVQKGGKNRFEQPLQPEVVAFIQNHWDKLDGCFRMLAVEKGIVKRR